MCPKSPKEKEQLSKENLRLKSAVEELSILNDIATAIASTQSLNQITNLIVKKCVKHLESEQGSIQLVDEKDFVNPFHTMIRVKDSVIGKSKTLAENTQLIAGVKSKIRAVDKSLNELRDTPEKPELSGDLQDLIKKLFSFSQTKEAAAIEGAVALAKFGQYEQALKEFHRLLEQGVLPVVTAKNMIKCYAALKTPEAAVAQFGKWKTRDFFSTEDLKYIRTFSRPPWRRKVSKRKSRRWKQSLLCLPSRKRKRKRFFLKSPPSPFTSRAGLWQLFRPFEQADNSATRAHSGTGLGLAVTRRFARAMGGDAGAESVAGKGSRFWFTAWLATAANAAAGEPALVPAPAEAGRFAGRRVLLVEDEPVNRLIARSLLEQSGLTVVEAADGAQALELAAAQPFDLILMDMQMPRMDGLEATRRLRQRSATPPIVALTANAFVEDRNACLASGMNDFLTKPVLAASLEATVGRWTQHAARAPRTAAAATIDACSSSNSIRRDPCWRNEPLVLTWALPQILRPPTSSSYLDGAAKQ